MPKPRTTGRRSNDAGQVLVRLNAEELAAVKRAARGEPLAVWARAVLMAATAARRTA